MVLAGEEGKLSADQAPPSISATRARVKVYHQKQDVSQPNKPAKTDAAPEQPLPGRQRRVKIKEGEPQDFLRRGEVSLVTP